MIQTLQSELFRLIKFDAITILQIDAGHLRMADAY